MVMKKSVTKLQVPTTESQKGSTITPDYKLRYC